MAAIRRQLPGLLRLVPRVAHVRSSEPLAPRSLVRGLSAAQMASVPAVVPRDIGTSRGFASEPLQPQPPAGGTSIPRTSSGHIVPHGGTLVDLMVTEQSEKEDLLASCHGAHIDLNQRQACDVELLITGGFSPLQGFMGKEEYDAVVNKMRLPGSDLLFGLPVVMDTYSDGVKEGARVALHFQGEVLAVMEVSSKWVPDKAKEAMQSYRTTSIEHPGVLMITTERGPYYLGGKLWGFSKPKRVFPCATPKELRADLPPNTDVVAFQCRNPVHRAHYELFTRALYAENVGKDGVVLVHPTCGPTQADDIPGIVRYQTYEVLKAELNNPRIKWAYLPYSMHMAGPREAIQHMLMRKNYGCTHFIIGRDMAGSKSSITGEDFYAPYDAQDFAKEHAAELGMQTVPSLNVVYTTEKGYVTADVAKEKGLKPVKLSGTEFRRRLRAGEDIPDWFAFKSVVEVLRKEAQTASA